MAKRTYLNVISEFDSIGYMKPRAIIRKDDRTFKIDEIRGVRKPIPDHQIHLER